MRALYTSILVCVCLVFAGISFAQSSCDQQIIVNVQDSKGDFVSDLQASSFHAKIAGHEASVSSANVFVGSNRLVLVLDASGSMTTERNMSRWNAIKNLAEQIVYFAPPSTRLASLVFNSQTIRKLEFGHPRKELLDAIDQLPDAHGMTSLWTSLLEAGEMFGDPALGDAVLVLSDFGDDTHKTTAAQVQKGFVGKGTRMFGVGIFAHYFSTEEEREGPEAFGDLVKETGGYVVNNIGEYRNGLPGLLKQLFDATGQLYVLRITPSAPLQKPERLNLSLFARDGKKNKGISLYYPEKVFHCGQ